MIRRYLTYFFGLLLLFNACKKDDPSETIPNNNAPYYKGIQRVVIENYVNRLFIDLIGREPLDTEMKAEVDLLQQEKLSMACREQLIRKLQKNTDFIPGDISYNHAYYKRFYELCKARLLEGASDDYLNGEIANLKQEVYKDSLAGDLPSMAKHKEQLQRLENVKRSESQYRLDSISINDVYARMIHNAVYDQINMNTFNFINATFDDLFARTPTQSEFDNAFDMVDNNTPQLLFGISGQNKLDYISILVHSNEFYEGLIRWAYKTLMARPASSEEIYSLMPSFYQDRNFQKVQEMILKTDEYANFK